MRNFDGNLAQTRFVNRFLLLPRSHPGGSSGASRKRKGAPSLGGHMGGHRRIWSHYFYSAFVPRSQPLSSGGRRGVGGPDPSKRPGRVPRPPTLVAPLRGATRGAREGTRSLAQGQFRFSALIKGFLRVPHPLSPFECAPFERENYRQFFHRPSSRLYNTMEYYIVLYSTV